MWYLFGMYAERSGDSERAIASYDRAIQADSGDYRPFLNRGNVHFQEGDFQEAIRDYEAAAQRAPKVAEIQYNLAVARGEAYDFDGQTAAMAKARALSPADVPTWTEHPTLVARDLRRLPGLSRAPPDRGVEPAVEEPAASGPRAASLGRRVSLHAVCARTVGRRRRGTGARRCARQAAPRDRMRAMRHSRLRLVPPVSATIPSTARRASGCTSARRTSGSRRTSSRPGRCAGASRRETGFAASRRSSCPGRTGSSRTARLPAPRHVPLLFSSPSPSSAAGSSIPGSCRPGSGRARSVPAAVAFARLGRVARALLEGLAWVLRARSASSR